MILYIKLKNRYHNIVITNAAWPITPKIRCFPKSPSYFFTMHVAVASSLHNYSIVTPFVPIFKYLKKYANIEKAAARVEEAAIRNMK